MGLLMKRGRDADGEASTRSSSTTSSFLRSSPFSSSSEETTAATVIIATHYGEELFVTPEKEVDTSVDVILKMEDGRLTNSSGFPGYLSHFEGGSKEDDNPDDVAHDAREKSPGKSSVSNMTVTDECKCDNTFCKYRSYAYYSASFVI